MKSIFYRIWMTTGCLMATAIIHAQNLDVSIVNTGANKIQIQGVANVNFTTGANNQWTSMNISWRIPKTAVTSPLPTVAPPSATPEVTGEATQFSGAAPRDAYTGTLDLAMFDLTSFGQPDDSYWYFQVTGTTGTLQNISQGSSVVLYEFSVPVAWSCAACVEILQTDIAGLPISTTSFIDNGGLGDVLRIMTNNAPLPVQFMDFEASAAGNTVQLSWKTTNEENVKGYYVQRSDNGRNNWTDLYFIPFKEDGNAVHNYTYTDAQPLERINYYRIRGEDVDGRSMLSAVRTVKFDGSGQMVIAVYPVPVQQTATLRIESPVHGNTLITLTDLMGRTLLQQRTVINAGINIISLQMDGLPSGTYFIQVQNQEQKWIRKIVKD